MLSNRAIRILMACLFALYLAGCAATPHPPSPTKPRDSGTQANPTIPRTVYLQPLESLRSQPLGSLPVRQKVVDEVVSAIEASYKVEVVVLPTRPLPDTAYYKPRRRYRAEKLLDTFEGTMPSGEDKIVVLTEVDISTTKGEYADWGLFGLGNMPGQACVVSTWRLRSKASQRRFRERLGKVVVHELGHTLGLAHCPTQGCLMEDAKGRVSTVDGETGFCESCRENLGDLLK